jgi:membrane-bound inhibitor of C-type lysozyme
MDVRHRKAMRLCTGLLAALAAATTAAGALNVPAIAVSGALVRDYHCQGGQSLQVTYYNSADGQSFALLPVKGKAMLFVDTLAASGVKYVAGPYVWWTKGEHGDLYDMTAGPDAAPAIAGCTSAPAR